VYRLALDRRSAVPGTLRRLSPSGNFGQPMVTRCGRRVAWWGAGTAGDTARIWVAATDGAQEVRCVSRGAGIQGHPYWHPDGRRLAHFASPAASWNPQRQFSTERPPANLWWLDVETGESTPLTEGPHVDERPAVAPDGRTVVFVSNRSGRLNLWRVNADGKGLTQVTDGPGPDYRPCISPDGLLLAFFSPATGGAHQVRLLELATGEERACDWTRRFTWSHGPFWYPDGQSLLVHAHERGARAPALWQVNLGHSDVRRLDTPGLGSASHGTVDDAERWLVFDSRDSPDGGVDSIARC
jgi:Tol biopolymer transport system component